MLFRDIIELVTETNTTTNAIGDVIYNRTYKQVYANKMAIMQAEFYQSHAQGLAPDLKFKIRFDEYDNQTQVRFPVSTGKLYDITRTYNSNDEFIELTCKGVVADANS